jgi:hypothetical protein
MGCLVESLTLLNEFQNPQIFQQTIILFPEQSTLVLKCDIFYWINKYFFYF